jgi:hypothetical protein
MNHEPQSVQRLRQILRKNKECFGVDLTLHRITLDKDAKAFIKMRNWKLKGKYLFFNPFLVPKKVVGGKRK